jgi:hypothetical protein
MDISSCQYDIFRERRVSTSWQFVMLKYYVPMGTDMQELDEQ